MIINPSLIVVSALFFMALSSVFYVGALGLVTLIFKVFGARISHAAHKRALMTALVVPPIIAIVPTVSGATLKHDHTHLAAQHHSALCQQMFSHFLSATQLHGSVAAGIVVNGVAWGLLLCGVVFVVRLAFATISLEYGLKPFLTPPSAELVQALETISVRAPYLKKDQFYECAIPASFSSVLGLIRVRCVLSEDFVRDATDDELLAVVAHESSHLRSRDVQATFLVGVINCIFFAVRPVRLLARRWREEAELASDDEAVSITSDPLAMASAILRVSGTPVQRPSSTLALPATTLAFADDAACAPSKRVERLLAQAQSAVLIPAGERPMQTVAAWGLTLVLAGIGLAILVSAEAACYAHCSLEAVAKLVP